MAKWLLVLLAACDFQPAPRPVVVEAKPVDAAAVAVIDDAGVGSGDAGIEVSDACMKTSYRIAEVLIANQKDEAAKASYETARARIVQATAEVCTTQAWSREEMLCFRQAKLEADLAACEKKFPPPKP